MEEASRKNPGTMASVIGIADIGVVEGICEEAGCEIANLNCPGQVVISGGNDSVDKAMEMGINWWQQDSYLSSNANKTDIEKENKELRKRLERNEELRKRLERTEVKAM